MHVAYYIKVKASHAKAHRNACSAQCDQLKETHLM